MTIHKLPVHVINQIAAGEVVERPAHMVKELVENSLDAGATEIEVAFDHGGRTVEITDNGSGISVEDLPLVFSRHATSKISGPDDLWKLQTFGFRGEALASISAVSSVRLISKIDSQNAYRLDVNFGEILEPLEASGPQGTRLVIESLFENVPARLKFLKSETAEASQIKNVLKSLAMAHPLVTFRLKQKNKLIEVWQKRTNALDRIRDLLGVDEIFSETLMDQGYRAEVHFASPHNVSKTSRQMWFFVNHRSIQDRTLQAASMDAFQGLLMHGEFPLCVVFVDIPEGLVDVNIHPTKSQVKFQDNSFVFRLVRRALRNGLERAPWLSQQTSNFETSTPPFQKNPQENSPPPVWQTTSEIAQEFPLSYERTGSHTGMSSGTSSYKTRPTQYAGSTERVAFTGMVKSPQPIVNERAQWAALEVLGQAHLTYIVTQAADKMVLVDQHAAHERVMYERIMRHWKEGHGESQQLLLPLEIALEAHLIEAILKSKSDIEKFGFVVELGGPELLFVQEHPHGFKEKAIVAALTQMANEIHESGGSLSLERVISDFCATMACHSAIRAGDRLEHQQMTALLEQMDEFPLSSFCPHGRPVSVDISFRQLERDFGRIV